MGKNYLKTGNERSLMKYPIRKTAMMSKIIPQHRVA